MLFVRALDGDSGEFGRVVYSFDSPHEPFDIDSNSGAITLTAPLDREAKAEHELTVVAR